MSDPDYLEARIEILGAGTPLTRLAEELNSRILAKPKPSEGVTELFIEHAVDPAVVVRAIRSVLKRAHHAGLGKSNPVVYVGRHPRGTWAILRGAKFAGEISGLLERSGVDLDPQALDVTPGHLRLSVVGLRADTETFARDVTRLFGYRTQVGLRPLAYPPVERLLEIHPASFGDFDEMDLKIIEECVADGYFDTPRRIDQKTLAKRLGIHPPELSRRMKRLQEIGFKTVLSMVPVEWRVAEAMGNVIAKHPDLFELSREPDPKGQVQSEKGQRTSLPQPYLEQT